MKSRLAASAYIFLAGKCWRNTRGTVSSTSEATFLGRRHCKISWRLASFHAQRFESSSRALHSSALEDDAFSELGPEKPECPSKKIKLATEKPDYNLDADFSELDLETSECSAKKIKLVTEKPDHFLKNRPRKKESASRPLSSDNRPDVKGILAAIGGSCKTSSPKLGGDGHAPTYTDNSRKIADIDSRRSVSINNVPAAVELTELIGAISVFGRVSGGSFATTSNRLRCCNIEFEDIDSSRRAILSGKITVGNQVFPVDPLDCVDLVTIRIKNINEKTADYAIHSMCKSVGEFVGLTRTSKDCVDAFFNVQNHTTHLDIVKKLNNTTFDLNRWSAHVLTTKSKSSEVPSDDEARHKLGLQIFDHFSELKRQIHMKRVCLEDLEHLTASIMHIEAMPPATNRSVSG